MHVLNKIYSKNKYKTKHVYCTDYKNNEYKEEYIALHAFS